MRRGCLVSYEAKIRGYERLMMVGGLLVLALGIGIGLAIAAPPVWIDEVSTACQP